MKQLHTEMWLFDWWRRIESALTNRQRSLLTRIQHTRCSHRHIVAKHRIHKYIYLYTYTDIKKLIKVENYRNYPAGSAWKPKKWNISRSNNIIIIIIDAHVCAIHTYTRRAITINHIDINSVRKISELFFSGNRRANDIYTRIRAHIGRAGERERLKLLIRIISNWAWWRW